MNSSRFASPVVDLDLDRLRDRTGRGLWAAMGLALAAHLAVVVVNPFHQDLERTPRPLTTRFIKREPRLTKPLELRKIPQPKRQLLRRQVRLAAARMDQVQATAAFDTRGLIDQAAVTSASLTRENRAAAAALEPASKTEAIRGARQPASKIDMALEMLDIGSLDTGRYRAMVVQDPGNPQTLRGFLKISRVFPERPSQGERLEIHQSADNLFLLKLVTALRRYTDLKVDFLDHMSLADERLLDTPIIIYRGGWSVGIDSARPSEQELQQLASYVLAGGFVLGYVPDEALVKYGGLVEGRDYFRERLPKDHSIYHCFFRLGGRVIVNEGNPRDRNDLSGLWIGDRLATVDIIDIVNEGGDAYEERILHMLVNVAVFALTQEGSMTQRLMQITR